MSSLSSIVDPTRPIYNYDRASGRAMTSPISPTTAKGPQSVRTLPPSPAGADEEGGAMPQPRLAGLHTDLQGQANNYANTAFNTHWQGLTQRLDTNNNDAVEAFAKQHGVSRGRVGMTIDTGKNDMSGGALGPGIRQTGEYHTMSNEELLAAAKSRARQNFTSQIQTGIAGSPLPPSPAGFGPIGPTAAGPAMGTIPPSPAGYNGPSPQMLQGYQQTAGGLMPGQAPLVARQMGMQPYDVAEQQTRTVAGRTAAEALPGQIAAQNALAGAQTGQAAANASKLNAEATTLVPAQAKEAEGRGDMARGTGAKEQALATGALLPDAVRKQLDDQHAKHQQEITALNAKLGALQEQLRIARGGEKSGLPPPGSESEGVATGAPATQPATQPPAAGHSVAAGTPATSTQPFQPAVAAGPNPGNLPPGLTALPDGTFKHADGSVYQRVPGGYKKIKDAPTQIAQVQ